MPWSAVRRGRWEESPAVQDDFSLSFSSVSLSRGGRELFRDFSFRAEEKKVSCIMAPSGSGKTTLLSWLAQRLCGQGRSVSFLFQEPRLIPTASVLQNVLLPLSTLMPPDKAAARARDFLRCVQLEQKAQSLPGELSGGELRRAAVARSFAYPARILLMDEPFQSQDLRIKLELCGMLRELLREEPRTVLCVSHDIREAVEISDRISIMDGSPLTVKADIRDVQAKPRREVEARIESILCARGAQN